MITIADILKPGNIELELKMTNQEEAVNHIASLLKEDERVKDWGGFYKGLSSNQPCLAAASGSDLCIPHTRTDTVTGMVMGAGRSKAGIVVPGGVRPVHFIFVIGVPVAMAADYLRIIGALTRVFRDEGMRAGMMEARTAEEFLKMLGAAEMKL
jgi:PTS system fructose-specific IIC component